jgi:hypothetical protein
MRFHFDLEDRLGFIPDEEGRELPNVEAARREALKGARSIISAGAEKGLIDLTGRILVRDDEGADVLTLSFDEAVSIEGRRSGFEADR